jgi:nucleoid-associated protein YgaU
VKFVAKSILFSAVIVCFSGCVSSGSQESSEALDPSAEAATATEDVTATVSEPEVESANADGVDTSEALPEFNENDDYRLEDENAAADFSEQAVMQAETNDSEASFSLNEIQDPAALSSPETAPAAEISETTQEVVSTEANEPAVANEEVTKEESAPALTTDATSNVGSTSYVVTAGDTLSHIAQRLLGSAYKWKELASLNQIANPNLIYPGQTLQIQGAPALSQR